MTDVERLREAAGGNECSLLAQAAAEIEKLRAERDALLYQFNELMLEVWHQLGLREEYQETDDVKVHETRCRALLGDVALASGAKDG